MTDWNKVAELIRWAPNNDNTYEENDAIRAAISLCERMAKGELVERSELDELDRLKTRVRELELVWAYYERLHDGHSEAVFKLCSPPDHYIDLEEHEKRGPR